MPTERFGVGPLRLSLIDIATLEDVSPDPIELNILEKFRIETEKEAYVYNETFNITFTTTFDLNKIKDLPLYCLINNKHIGVIRVFHESGA